MSAPDAASIGRWLALLRDGTDEERRLARTELGLLLEARGLLDEASEAYERNVADGVADRRPYERLAALAHRRGDAATEARALRALANLIAPPVEVDLAAGPSHPPAVTGAAADAAEAAPAEAPPSPAGSGGPESAARTPDRPPPSDSGVGGAPAGSSGLLAVGSSSQSVPAVDPASPPVGTTTDAPDSGPEGASDAPAPGPADAPGARRAAAADVSEPQPEATVGPPGRPDGRPGGRDLHPADADAPGRTAAAPATGTPDRAGVGPVGGAGPSDDLGAAPDDPDAAAGPRPIGRESVPPATAGAAAEPPGGAPAGQPVAAEEPPTVGDRPRLLRPAGEPDDHVVAPDPAAAHARPGGPTAAELWAGRRLLLSAMTTVILVLVGAMFLRASEQRSARPAVSPTVPSATSSPLPVGLQLAEGPASPAPVPSVTPLPTAAPAASPTPLSARCVDAAERFPETRDTGAAVRAAFRQFLARQGVTIDPASTLFAGLADAYAERHAEVVAGWMAVTLQRERRGLPTFPLTDYVASDVVAPSGPGEYQLRATVSPQGWVEMSQWPAGSCEGAFMRHPDNARWVALMEASVGDVTWAMPTPSAPRGR